MEIDCVKSSYDYIFIIGNNHNKKLLDKLSGPKVKLITESRLTPEDMLDLVIAEKKKHNGRMLWVLTKSVYSISDWDEHPDCGSCKDYILRLSLKGQYSKLEIAERVQEILFLTNKLCASIQTELGSNGTILIVPPIPALIVQEAAFKKHSTLHRICSKYSCPCASDAVLFGLHIFYNILCDAWSSLASEWLLPFGNHNLFREFQSFRRGKNIYPIKDQESYEYLEDSWVTLMQAFTQLAFVGALSKDQGGVENNVNESVSLHTASRVNTHTALQTTGDGKAPQTEGLLQEHEKGEKNQFKHYIKKGEKNRFEHCIVVGTSVYFKQFRDLVRDLPVSFIEESLQLNSKGLDIIKEEKARFPKNSLWLVVRGVAEIADLKDVSPTCRVRKCHDPLAMFVLKNSWYGDPKFKGLSFAEMVDKVIDQAKSFAIKTSMILNESSVVFLSPIVPAAAYLGGNDTSLPHERLHDIADEDIETAIVDGFPQDWMAAVQELDEKWMQMLLSNLEKGSREYDIIKELVRGLSNLLIFTTEPQRNVRLEKVQAVWGNAMKALISSFLGIEDSKKSVENSKSSSKHDVETSASSMKPSVADLPANASDSGLGTQGNATTSSKTVPPDNSTDHPWAMLLKDPMTSYESAPPAVAKDVGLATKGNITTALPNVIPEIPSNQPMGYFDRAQGNPYDYRPMPFSPAPPQAFLPMVNQPFQAFPPMVNQPFHYQPPLTSAPGFMAQPLDKQANPRTSYYEGKPANNKGGKGASKMSNNITIKPNSSAPVKPAKPINVQNCKLIVNNYNTKISEEFARKILETCGAVLNLEYPMKNKPLTANTKAEKKSVSFQVQYNNEKSAIRAARVLKFLQVFGQASTVQLPGSKVKVQIRDLQTEDRLVVPLIQEIIVEMQKAKKQSAQVTIVAKKQIVSTVPPIDNKSVLSNTSAQKEPFKKFAPGSKVFHIHVSNLSKLLPHTAIKLALEALAPVSEGSLSNEEFVCQVADASQAMKIVMSLNNFRLPDTKLKVYTEEPLDFKNAPVKPAHESTERLSLVFKQFSEISLNCLYNSFKDDINYYTFKTEACHSIRCKDQALCQYYHNEKDCRRSPLIYIYSSSLCENAQKGTCQNWKECKLSHNLVERKFQLVRFRELLCDDAVMLGVCRVKGEHCEDVHPDTPEMFFHNNWKDVYVEGLGETFNYINGVIMKMFKLQNSKDLQVLVLTSSPDIVQFLMKVFQSTAKSCRQNLVAVAQYGGVANDGTIMVSTPSSLSKLLSRSDKTYSFETLRAIIIDDGLKVFTQIMNTKDVRVNELISMPEVNKVVIDDSISDGKVAMAAQVMKTTFKKIEKPPDQNKTKSQEADDKTSKPLIKRGILKSSASVFKVPALPVPKPKNKDSAFREKDSKSEKNEKTPFGSNPSGKGDEKTGSSIDPLKLIMANYKDFKKGGLNTEPVKKDDQDAESSSSSKWKKSSRGQQSTLIDGITDRSKDWAKSHPEPFSHPSKLNTNLVPFYKAGKDEAAYASIPFTYDDGQNTSASETKAKKEAPEKSSKSPPPKESRKSRASRWTPLESVGRNRSPARDSKRSRSPETSYKKDSRRHSPPSSPARDSKRSRSPETSYKKDSRRHSPPSSSKSKSNDNKKYIKAEMELKEEHLKETKMFTDYPEFHPEYEEKYRIFSSRFEAQYSGQSSSKFKEEKWQEFWKLIVDHMQEARWKEKEDKLKKQWNVEPNKRKESDSRDDSERSRKSHKRDREKKEKSKSPERSSRRSDSERSRRRDREKDEGRDQSQSSNLEDMLSIKHALNSLWEVSEDLGGLKAALQLLVDKVCRKRMGPSRCISIIAENDHAMVLDMCFRKLENLMNSVASESQRNKYKKALKEAKILKDYASSDYSRNVPELDIATPDNFKSINPEIDTGGTKLKGLDVEKIAKATHEKSTEEIIEFIKNAFAYEGMMDTDPSDINEVFMAVSRLHFDMSLKGTAASNLRMTEDENDLVKRLESKANPYNPIAEGRISSPFQSGPSWLSPSNHSSSEVLQPGPSAFQQQQFGRDSRFDMSENLGDRGRPWNQPDKDKNIIDFMTERLKFLADDSNLNISEQGNEREEGNYSRSGEVQTNQLRGFTDRQDFNRDGRLSGDREDPMYRQQDFYRDSRQHGNSEDSMYRQQDFHRDGWQHGDSEDSRYRQSYGDSYDNLPRDYHHVDQGNRFLGEPRQYDQGGNFQGRGLDNRYDDGGYARGVMQSTLRGFMSHSTQPMEQNDSMDSMRFGSRPQWHGDQGSLPVGNRDLQSHHTMMQQRFDTERQSPEVGDPSQSRTNEIALNIEKFVSQFR